MDESLLLLEDRSPTLVHDAAHVLLLHTLAVTFAAAGDVTESFRILRRIHNSGIDCEHDTVGGILWDIVQAAKENVQKRYEWLEQELALIHTRALQSAPEGDSARIQVALSEVLVDLRGLMQMMADLGTAAQLARQMCAHGIDDEVLAWLEENFQTKISHQGE